MPEQYRPLALSGVLAGFFYMLVSKFATMVRDFGDFQGVGFLGLGQDWDTTVPPRDTTHCTLHHAP
jgi:hypothetical protein